MIQRSRALAVLGGIALAQSAVRAAAGHIRVIGHPNEAIAKRFLITAYAATY